MFDGTSHAGAWCRVRRAICNTSVGCRASAPGEVKARRRLRMDPAERSGACQPAVRRSRRADTDIEDPAAHPPALALIAGANSGRYRTVAKFGGVET